MMVVFYNGVKLKYTLVLLIFLKKFIDNTCGGTVCQYEDYNQNKSFSSKVTYSEMGLISFNDNTVECPKGRESCFTAWKNTSNGSVTIMKQGCWTDPADASCFNSDCISETYPKTRINSLFCCCRGSFCNKNFKSIFIPLELSSTTLHTPISNDHTREMNQIKKRYVYIGIGIFFLFAIFTTVLYLFVKWFFQKYHDIIKKDIQYNPINNHHNSKPKNSPKFLNLELMEILDRGRYGTIWKAEFIDTKQKLEIGKPVSSPTTDSINPHSSKDSPTICNNTPKIVVSKVFKGPYRSYYYNERDVYELPFMTHPNILEYLGCREIKTPGQIGEYWIVLAYHPDGCLQNYLKNNTINVSQFINIFTGVIKGLSYLQKLVVRDGKIKPPIAHRDLNTRNILVSQNGNHCVICDLGFAYPIYSNHATKVFTKDTPLITRLNRNMGRDTGDAKRMISNTNLPSTSGATNGEKTLADVGTIRYMAPEVLEGSINLRDCEAALKQVDMYALALIMWEVGIRCTTFYENLEPQEYELPFQKEVGIHPTFEDMQITVARNKCRPALPPKWKKNDQVLKLFKETLEHCWDQDAEARLSAFCVEERVNEMKAMLGITDNVTGNNLSNDEYNLDATHSSTLFSPSNLLVGYDEDDCLRNRNTDCNTSFGLSPNLQSNTTIETYLTESR